MTTQSDTPGEGLALVPKEPTEAMAEAGRLAVNRVFSELEISDPDDERLGNQAHNRRCAKACYRAMIAASPSVASDTAALPSGYEGLAAPQPALATDAVRAAVEQAEHVALGLAVGHTKVNTDEATMRLIELVRALSAQGEVAQPAAEGRTYRIEHDGFEGTVQGAYVTREGKRGVVLQQMGTRVIHVYGEKWLGPASTVPTSPNAASQDGGADQ